MGTDEEKEGALRGLEAAASFLRRQIVRRLAMRRAPELSFRYDDSIEQGAHVLELLDEVSDTEKDEP